MPKVTIQFKKTRDRDSYWGEDLRLSDGDTAVIEEGTAQMLIKFFPGNFQILGHIPELHSLTLPKQIKSAAESIPRTDTRNLLAITTAGNLNWLKAAVSTLTGPLDILVVDDATPSKVGIRAFCKRKKIALITKPKPLGATHSWNLVYKWFTEHNYEKCIISNDDVLFPNGFSNYLLQGLPEFDIVCPITNRPGDSRKQEVSKWVEIKPSEKNINQVQKALLQIETGSPHFIGCGYFNGFCFAFARSIAKFKFSEQLLFDPKYKNLGNELDLCKRIRRQDGTIAYCRLSYVFHWKSGTYRNLKLKDRDDNWR